MGKCMKMYCDHCDKIEVVRIKHTGSEPPTDQYCNANLHCNICDSDIIGVRVEKGEIENEEGTGSLYTSVPYYS